MGQCQVCTSDLDFNAIQLDSLVKEMGTTGLGHEVDQLRSENQVYLSDFKTTVMPDKTYYKGKLVEGKKQGYGELMSTSFNYYGHFSNDHPNGLGAIVTDNSCIYGNFSSGVMSGEIKEWHKKYKFEGKYSKGQRVEGSLTRDEITYVGQFQDDMYHGHGKLTLKDGGYYEGEFANGKFEGQGEINYSNGNKYKGHFKEGKYEGYGEFLWANGNYYKGEYKAGKRHGFGALKLEGFEYSGRWQNGVREGRGILSHEQDMGFGDWKDNRLVETD